MKKDIYIIKNDINNKVYIGQAKDTAKRFQGHCKKTQAKKECFVDKEIRRLGKEHFWYEILESQIENYNERERYWISYYDSRNNGYNRSDGGELSYINPSGVNSDYSVVKDQEMLNNIRQDLIEKKLSMSNMSKKYNISVATISNINKGITYHDDSLSYPLRPTIKGSEIYLTEEEKEAVRKTIKEELITFKEIAKKYNLSLNNIYHINSGDMWKSEKEDYPLRKFHFSEKNKLNQKQVKGIHEDLINTKMSLRCIAEKYETSIGTVQAIKNGDRKAYILKDYTYPLRPNNFKKPVSTISAKESTTTIDT